MAIIRGAVLPGGGGKGYITLAIIDNFEKYYGKSFFEHFDVCFGQSTGALIGSSLFSGVKNSRVVDFYKSNMKNIFTPQNSWWSPWDRVWEPKYDRERVIAPFKELMQEVNVTKYGNIQKKFVCGAVNQCTRENTFFKNTSFKMAECLVEDVVARSFSAGFYFGKYIDKTTGMVWADGGTGNMNTPIMQCYYECAAMAQPGDSVEIYLFGTGRGTYNVSLETAKKYNKFTEVWHTYFLEGEQLARFQSYQTQVNDMTWVANHTPNVTFKEYDITIPNKIDVIDGWKYMEQYAELGHSVKIY